MFRSARRWACSWRGRTGWLVIAPGGRWQRRGATFVVILVVVLLEMMTVVSPSAAVTPNDKMNGPAVATTLAADGVTPAPKITVLTGTPVIDQAALSGVGAKARGRIAYLVFSDPNCKTLVINASGGVKTAADFRITVTGGDPSPPSFNGSEDGTSVTFRTLTSVSYSADETAIGGYAKSLSTDCAGTIAANQSRTCTITNHDNAAPAA